MNIISSFFSLNETQVQHLDLNHDILSKVHEFHRTYASSSGLSNTILHEFKDNEPPIPCLYIDVNLCYVEILIFQVDMFTLGF